MKNLFSLLFLGLVPFLGPSLLLAQSPESEGEVESEGDAAAPVITVTSEWSSSVPDVRDLLIFENIDYQKMRFSAAELEGRNFALRVLEIWDGEVRDSALLATSVSSRGAKPLADSVFEVRVISRLDDQKRIRMHIHMPGATVRKTFETIPEQAVLYSLRNVVRDSKKDVVIGKPFYLMAHILPISVPDKPGWLSYCDVDNSGEDVREWGKKLSIPHYLAFEMVFY